MPTARELLEQAETLMRRNRSVSPVEAPPLSDNEAVSTGPGTSSPVEPDEVALQAALDDIPVLTDAVEDFDAHALAVEPPRSAVLYPWEEATQPPVATAAPEPSSSAPDASVSAAEAPPAAMSRPAPHEDVAAADDPATIAGPPADSIDPIDAVPSNPGETESAQPAEPPGDVDDPDTAAERDTEPTESVVAAIDAAAAEIDEPSFADSALDAELVAALESAPPWYNKPETFVIVDDTPAEPSPQALADEADVADATAESAAEGSPAQDPGDGAPDAGHAPLQQDEPSDSPATAPAADAAVASPDAPAASSADVGPGESAAPPLPIAETERPAGIAAFVKEAASDAVPDADETSSGPASPSVAKDASEGAGDAAAAEDTVDIPAILAAVSGEPQTEDARWNALAEEVRMQVLQRIDIFTDTGLREQLNVRLQPIVDRASADLVAAINQHVGQLLREYVAEAIEREIDKWREEKSRP